MKNNIKNYANSLVEPIVRKIILEMGFILAVMLSSCTPTAYIVDTTHYTKQIAASPEAVTIKPEHVTEVGGFQAEFGATVRTDQGEVNISDSGVSGNVVIDLRSGK